MYFIGNIATYSCNSTILRIVVDFSATMIFDGIADINQGLFAI